MSKRIRTLTDLLPVSSDATARAVCNNTSFPPFAVFEVFAVVPVGSLGGAVGSQGVDLSQMD